MVEHKVIVIIITVLLYYTLIAFITSAPIEIRKNLGTISILGYFDGIYTVTGFMHDIYTINGYHELVFICHIYITMNWRITTDDTLVIMVELIKNITNLVKKITFRY